MDTLLRAIATNVRYYRLANDLTQTDLALRAKVSRRLIHSIENCEHNLRFEGLIAVSRALDLSVAALTTTPTLQFKNGFGELAKMDWRRGKNWAYWVMDSNYIVREASKNISVVMGLTRDEIKNKSFFELLTGASGEKLDMSANGKAYKVLRKVFLIIGPENQQLGFFSYGIKGHKNLWPKDSLEHEYQILSQYLK